LPIGLVVAALGASCGSSDEEVSPKRWTLVMADEFDGEDGTPPSPDLWNIETGYGFEDSGWGNDEWQLYTDSTDNVRQEGGNLVVAALCDADPCGKRDGSITSARIMTQTLFEQKYGRFEARIKMPKGTGFWPAFWMLGANIDEVPWPGCGEIDIMEYYGNRPATVEASVHGPGYFAADPITNGLDLPEGEAFADDFHVFAVEWDPGRLTFSVDGQVQDGVVVGGEVYHIVRSADASPLGDWVFNNEFFVILNLAIDQGRAGAVNVEAFPGELLVDYVRVFERTQ
jgi:beta-glucanase (GH16 family)